MSLTIKLHEALKQYRAEMCADLTKGDPSFHSTNFVRKAAFATIMVEASSYEEAEQKAFRKFEARSAEEGFERCSIWSSWVVDASSKHHNPHKEAYADADYVWEL